MTLPTETAAELPHDLSWTEFLALPDEYRHAELIDGEIVMNPPSSPHQLVVGRLFAALMAWCDGSPGRGEPTMEPPVGISEQRGYLPDLAWFPPERCAPPGEPAGYTNPPGLAIEVLSPSTRIFDAVRKPADYARVGVNELWLIDPEPPRAIAWRHRSGSATGEEFDVSTELDASDALTSPALPGFSVVVGDLVRRPSQR